MKMYQVDAFTKHLFKGNPAAVLILDEWLDAEMMQNIAFENNLAETAFVKKIDDENYAIRWFTPTVEVDFCGHATLASAFVIFKDYTQAKKLSFHVKNLGIFLIQQAEDGKILMNFPVRKPYLIEEYPALLKEVIDQPIQEIYLNQQAFILVCESEQAVIAAKPDLGKIQAIAEAYAQDTTVAVHASGLDVVITAQSQPSNLAEYDYVARYFAPDKGINEDPVTGSMHTGLAPLWAEKLNKNTLIAYQASARGGQLYCDLQSDDRIEISGYAQLYMIAEIYI